MQTVRIPFDRSMMELHIAEENLAAVLTAEHAGDAANAEDAIVRKALRSPIGTPPLRELAKGKKRVVIVTSDHTRAMPSKITMPQLLSEIRGGVPDAEITIVIATGLHRATTEQEQRQRFGDEIVDRERIVVHNAFDPDACVRLCTLPSGASFCVNRLAVDCDLLVTEGFIEPHFFAGFSGGRKSILPGICSAETVNENHSYRAIADPHSMGGVLSGNVIHEDMVYAARFVRVAFILNVAVDAQKRIIGAWAGDLEEAHAEGVAFVRKASGTRVVTGDIVITGNGGYPLDQNLYQSPKAMTTAEACAGEDGVIIMCAGCSDGMGGENFAELMTMGDVETIERKLSAIPPKETIPEQWCVQVFCRILRKHNVIVVSTGLPPELVRRANLIPAESVDDALRQAYAIKGKDARVVVIPDGVATMIMKDTEER